MSNGLVGVLVLVLVASIEVSFVHAQSSNASTQQQLACQEKIVELTGQLSPLQKKRTTLWSERKSIGSSGGDSAKYKLARLDQEISQVTKQIDGVTRQIDTEKKHCDELASKPSGSRSSSQAQPSSQSQSSSKPRGNSRRQ